jgi:hypothetical protein
MSLGDGFLVAFAVIDILCVAAMVVAALAMAREGKATAARAQPAVAHARRTIDAGKRVAIRAKDQGTASWHQLRELGERIRHRVETTRHIIRELKPPREEIDTRALVRDAQSTLARGQEWAGRLSRLHRAGAGASSKRGGASRS